MSKDAYRIFVLFYCEIKYHNGSRIAADYSESCRCWIKLQLTYLCILIVTINERKGGVRGESLGAVVDNVRIEDAEIGHFLMPPSHRAWTLRSKTSGPSAERRLGARFGLALQRAVLALDEVADPVPAGSANVVPPADCDRLVC